VLLRHGGCVLRGAGNAPDTGSSLKVRPGKIALVADAAGDARCNVLPTTVRQVTFVGDIRRSGGEQTDRDAELPRAGVRTSPSPSP
jgi:hypothetical protein